MTVETVYQYIISTPEIAGGKPRIVGHRITVQNIVIWHEQMRSVLIKLPHSMP